MSSTQRSLLVLVFSLIGSHIVSAQVKTGTPPFGSYGGGPDVINLANLNAHLTIPVFDKPGRGRNFGYDLGYDSSVWYPVGASGHQVWTYGGGGWAGETQVVTGYISYGSSQYSQTQQYCGPSQGYLTITTNTYSNWSYTDPFGISHGYSSSSSTTYYSGCSQNYSTSTGFVELAADGSGYSLNVQGQCSPCYAVARDGSILNASSPNGTGIATDRNGNQITADGTGKFYDTLSSTAPVLTITGSGTASSPMKFTYTAPGPSGTGVPAFVQVNYTNYTVASNFAVSGINEYKSVAAVPLVSSIVLSDGSQYSFQYEATPSTAPLGACSPYAGTTCVTARIHQITLPGGGTITYTYSGGASSSGSGIWNDGSVATLQRLLSDGGSWSATWNYAQTKGTGAASTTTVTDPERDTLAPNGNDIVIQFQGIYETQRQFYQGSHTSGTLLATTNTCYNASASPCNSTAITLPINQRTVIAALPGPNNLQSKHNDFFNAVGVPTETDDYDFGSGAPQSSPLRQVLYTYAPLGSITGFRKTVVVKDGSGTTLSTTTYSYDEGTVAASSGSPQHTTVSGSRGNLTSIYYSVGINKSFTFYDTGTVKTATDFNGAVTTFNYPDATSTCGNAFPTSVSITQPISMSTSTVWNCAGGVATSTTDVNGKTTTSSFTDTNFWRPASVTDPANAATSFVYATSSPYNNVETKLLFNSNNSVIDALEIIDGLGRPHLVQIKQGPSATNYDSTETDFDAIGRPSRVTMPYSGTAGQTNSSGPSTTTTYDTLGRPHTVTDAGGGSVAYSYSNNDVLVVVGPNPTGENTKQRQLEYDSLGRLTSVCEITAGTTVWPSGSCGQNTSATGYLTQYTFDALGNLLTVKQNAQSTGNQQTRSYVFDAMSRLTSETNAESGTTAYVYDTDATCGTSSGDPVKKTDAVGNVTCTAYDVLHRPTAITYPSGSYASVTPAKHFVYDAATVNGVAMSNAKTRLAEAYTCTGSCSSKITDEGFSYTARGEVSDLYESTPQSGGYYHLTQTYWPHGAPNQLSGLAGLPTITYGGTIGSTVGLDGEGRITQVTAAGTGQQNPVTGVTYNTASLPAQVTFGSGDADIFAYDSNTLRMTQYKFNVGSPAQSLIGNLTWNANGSLGQLAITNPFYSADTQTCNYSHDDLARIAQVDCGAGGWGQSFVYISGQNQGYDPFGNLTKYVPSNHTGYSFQPTYNSATNRFATLPGTTPSYDSNGNVLSDGSHSYSWDAYGKAITVDSVNLTYDALGRMVEQNRSGSFTQIVYSPSGTKLALMNGQSILVKSFVPLPGGATAVYTGSGLDHYRHSDWLGNARLSTSPSQTFASSAAYAPFGETYANSSGSPDVSFTGMNSDTTADDYDFLFREYSTQGRWTSPDPSGLAAVDPTNPQSWNRYAYVLNDPLRQVDPQGLDGCEDSGFDDESSCDPTGEGWGGGGGGGGGGDTGITPPIACTDIFDACTPGALNADAQPNLAAMKNEGPGGYDYGGVSVFGALSCAAANNPTDPGCWGVSVSASGGTVKASWSLDSYALAAGKLISYGPPLYPGGPPTPIIPPPSPLDPTPRLISLRISPLPNPTARAYICGPLATEIRQLQGNPSEATQLAALRALYNKSCN